MFKIKILLMALLIPVQVWAQEIVLSKQNYEKALSVAMNQVTKYRLAPDVPEDFYTYYQTKNPQKAVAVLKTICEQQVLSKSETAAPGVLGFLIGLKLEGSQEVFNETFCPETEALKVQAQDIVSENKDLTTILKKQRDRDDFTPAQLDKFWGLFFATGDQRIVELMAFFGLKHKEPTPVDEENVAVSLKNMAAVSVVASVSSNAVEHPIVKAAVQNATVYLFVDKLKESPSASVTKDYDFLDERK